MKASASPSSLSCPTLLHCSVPPCFLVLSPPARGPSHAPVTTPPRGSLRARANGSGLRSRLRPRSNLAPREQVMRHELRAPKGSARAHGASLRRLATPVVSHSGTQWGPPEKGWSQGPPASEDRGRCWRTGGLCFPPQSRHRLLPAVLARAGSAMPCLSGETRVGGWA